MFKKIIIMALLTLGIHSLTSADTVLSNPKPIILDVRSEPTLRKAVNYLLYTSPDNTFVYNSDDFLVRSHANCTILPAQTTQADIIFTLNGEKRFSVRFTDDEGYRDPDTAALIAGKIARRYPLSIQH